MEILKVELLTNDVTGTEEFYAKLFGLKMLHKDSTSVSFAAGNSTLTFRKSENLKPFYHFAFNIPGDKLNEALEWTALRTEIGDVEPGKKTANFTEWNAKSFYFRDNNANILEFIVRFDLNKNSSSPFRASSILSISEIGLVFDNVMEESRKLISEHNLEYFSKSAPHDTFTALGDDNGLLILVKTGREWFPPYHGTAEKFPMKVKIKNKGKVSTIIR